MAFGSIVQGYYGIYLKKDKNHFLLTAEETFLKFKLDF